MVIARKVLSQALSLLTTLLFSPLIVTSALAAVINGNDFDNSLYGTMADDAIRGCFDERFDKTDLDNFFAANSTKTK